MPYVPPLPILPEDPEQRRRIYLRERARYEQLARQYGRTGNALWPLLLGLAALAVARFLQVITE